MAVLCAWIGRLLTRCSVTLEKLSASERQAILEAMKSPPPAGYFVWDGKDEDARPATLEELQAGVEAARRGRGRPAGSGTKEQAAIRLDRAVLAALRPTGPGWQTRLSDAVGTWVKAGQL